ncbi:mechanosensitive ion channel family protein [bacterium]|nr:mechanosensitive ion channel family protein [bacterium]
MERLEMWFPDEHYRVIVSSLLVVVCGFVLAQLVHVLFYLTHKIITSRTKTDLDDKILDVSRRSVQRIIVVWGFYIATDWLDDVYQGTWTHYADGIFFVIVVFLISVLISNINRVVMEWYVTSIAVRTDSPVDDEIVPLVKRVSNLLLYSIAGIICLDHFHIDIKALVVSLGVGSFAVAFAAQETLANMIAGFVIMVDRPFRVGDRIRVTATQQVGDVIQVGLRSTKILDFDNNIVTIPNAQIIKGDIINFSYPEAAMRVKIEIGIAYGSDIEKAKKIMEGTCASFPVILTDPAPKAYLVGFGDSALNMIVVARASHYKEAFEVSDQIRIKIHDEFVKAGIEIPFPQRVVHMQKN